MPSTIEHFATSPATRWSWVAASLCVLILVGCLTFIFARPGAYSTNSDSLRWVQVQPRLLENRLGLIGRIEASTRQTMVAPFGGIVQHLAVREGQSVERGQLLLRLDTVQLDIQLRRALAELLKAKRDAQDLQGWESSDEVARARRAVTNAELSLNDTVSRLSDTRRLFERGIVPRMEVDALEQQLRLQQVDLAASQSELRTVRSKGRGESLQMVEMELVNAQAHYDGLLALRAQGNLHAPFAGIAMLPQRADETGRVPPLQVGQRVTQGMPLLELVTLENLNAVGRIDESDLHLLQEEMPVEVTGDGFSGLMLQGRVLAIGAQALVSEVYGGGSSYEVVVGIDPLSPDLQQRMRLGMSTRLTVVTYRAENGLAVPVDAVRYGEDGDCFVIYRRELDEPSQRVAVVAGRAVPHGVEVFGLMSGYVELPPP